MNTLGIWVEWNKQKQDQARPNKGGKKQEQIKPDQNNKSNSINLQVHINLWKMRLERSFSRKEFDHFFDIGLRLPSIAGIAKLNIYLPFDIAQNNCLDLGGAFHEDSNLVNAIFNEHYKLSGIGTKILKVERQDGSDTFNIYRLDLNSDVSLTQHYSGTVIEINLSKITQRVTEPFYFRFRIRSPKVQQFTKEYEPENRLFESAFTNTEIVDFRINEIRSLDKSLVEKMDSDGGLPFIGKIHFILLRNAKDDYIFSHKPITSCRELEKEIWKTYLELNNRKYHKDKILAYHWKEESKNDPKSDPAFRSLIKMKFEKNNCKTMAKYLLIIAVLSVSFNLLSSFIYNKIEPNPNSAQTNQSRAEGEKHESSKTTSTHK